MTPLAIFLLACGAVLVGTVSAAFSTMMRLSLRLTAERSDRESASRIASRPEAATQRAAIACHPAAG